MKSSHSHLPGPPVRQVGLIFTNQDHAGRAYELTLEKTTVGRGDQNTLVIADSSLSAVHCEILVNGPEVIVRDLGSRNGTFVNGAKLVNQQSQLKSGQTVRFGAVEARLELDSPPAEDTASDITAIHTMGRIMREQRREREKPRPANPSMKLGSSDSSTSDDRTVTAHDVPGPKESPAPASLGPVASQPDKSSTKAVVVIVIVTALALGLMVLLWWLWGGK